MKLAVASSIAIILSTTGCKGPQSYSTPNLVGGQDAKAGEYESIVQLDLNDSDKRKCSAVKLSDDVAILAAHCIKKGPDSAESDESGISLGTIKSLRYYGYRNVMGLESLKAVDATHDLAAVVFPSNTFKAPYASLSFQTSLRKREQLVELVGFGSSSFDAKEDAEPKKRWGTNRITNAVTGLITISEQIESVSQTARSGLKKTEDNNSIAFKGDSGGPMIVGDKVVGIAVGAFFSPDKAGKTKTLSKENDSKYVHNIYLDLNSPSSRALLSYVKNKESAKGNNLEVTGLVDIKIPSSSSRFLAPRDEADRNSGDIVAICGGGGGGGGEGNSGGGQGGFGSNNNSSGAGNNGIGNNGNGFGTNNFDANSNTGDSNTSGSNTDATNDANTNSTNTDAFGGPNQNDTATDTNNSSTESGGNAASTALYKTNCEGCHAAGTYSKAQWDGLLSGSTTTPNKMADVMKSLRSSGDISKIRAASQLN